MEFTDTEKRLDQLLEQYLQTMPQVRQLHERLTAVAREFSQVLPLELVAASMAQHSAALVSAQKMTQVMRPVLADTLAQDFYDMVIRRSVPGVPCLLTKGARRG